MDDYEFGRWADIICSYIIDYNNNLGNMDVIPNVPNGYLFQTLKKEVPEKGENFAAVWEDFTQKIFPGILHWNHPFNFSHFPNPNNYTNILGDILASSIGGVGFSWKSCPALTELETLMCDWYADVLGIPTNFSHAQTKLKGGGTFHQTTSDAIYSVILAARFRVLFEYENQGQDPNLYVAKLAVYASEDCHFGVQRFCSIEGITFNAVKTESDGSMSVKDLQENIEKDKKNGLIPILVVATLGSFLKFGVDDVEKIYAVTSKEKTIWLLADASYGGNAMFLKDYSYMRKGLQHADSILASPHKWLPVAMDSVVLWNKDVQAYQKCFEINPIYIRADKPNTTDLRHFGIALTRRFRAFKVWFTFRTYGRSGLEKCVDNAVKLTAKFSAKLKDAEFFDVVYEKFTFVYFVIKDKSNQTNRRLFEDLKKTRKILLHPVNFNGKFTLRFSVISEHTTMDHINQAVGFLQEAAINIFENSEESSDEESSGLEYDDKIEEKEEEE